MMEAVNEEGVVVVLGSAGMKRREKAELGELQYWSGSQALRAEPGGISSAVAERRRKMVMMMMRSRGRG